MKIRSHTQTVEDLLPEIPQPKLEVRNSKAEIRRVVKRLRALMVPHMESAGRLGVVLGPEDIRAVLKALIAEADRLSPDPHLQCPEELRHYLRRTMFDELLSEPSNVFYTTRVSEDVMRFEAMPSGFWKECLTAMLSQVTNESPAS